MLDAQQCSEQAAALSEAAEEASRLYGLLRARHDELEVRSADLRCLQVPAPPQIYIRNTMSATWCSLAQFG